METHLMFTIDSHGDSSLSPDGQICMGLSPTVVATWQVSEPVVNTSERARSRHTNFFYNCFENSFDETWQTKTTCVNR